MQTFLKPLTPKEEAAYLEIMMGKEEEKSKWACGKLIEHNLRLVAHIVKKYQQPEVETEDLLSIGTVGLIKAVQSFNPEKQSKLGTYAARCIENAILTKMRLWFQINPPRAKKNQNGIFWHKFPRTSTSFVSLRTAM